MDQKNRVKNDSSEAIPPVEVTETPATRTCLAAKLAAIAGRVGGIPKDRKNEAQGYMFRSDDTIMEHLRPLYAESGVAINMRVVEFQNLGLTPKGSQVVHLVKVEIDFIDSETGETLTSSSYGTGSDSSDKAVYKAITGAVKYIFNKNLMISENDPRIDDGDGGGDPEAPTADDKPKPAATATKPSPAITNAQALQLRRDGDAGNVDWSKFCKLFAIESLERLPARRYNEANNMVQAKRRAAQGA